MQQLADRVQTGAQLALAQQRVLLGEPLIVLGLKLIALDSQFLALCLQLFGLRLRRFEEALTLLLDELALRDVLEDGGEPAPSRRDDRDAKVAPHRCEVRLEGVRLAALGDPPYSAS